jgi:hypothetical protein
MSEKFSEKALKTYQSGEKHLASGKYSKAEGDFRSAVDLFLKANEIERAEKCSLKLCECFIIEKKYYEAAGAAFHAAELSLHHKKYKEAIKHLESSIDFYTKVDADMEILEVYSILSLLNLVQGKFEEAAAIIKKKIVKAALPNASKNRIIQLSTLILNTILQKNAENLEEIDLQLKKLKLDEGYLSLFKTAQRIVSYYVETLVTINTNLKEIRAGDVFQVSIMVRQPPNLEILSSEISYDRLFDLIKEKSVTPDNKTISFELRPRIQGKLNIGPISLVCKIEELQFPIKIQRTIEVLPGKPEIVIEANSREILTAIGEPVTLVFTLKNIGKGESTNLVMTIPLPEELRLSEGTNEKKLHSLAPHEEFEFTYRIVANAPVSTSLSAALTYEDLEGKQSGITAAPIPFVVKT